MKVVPLTVEEQKETGILSLTKGPGVAIGYVKHIERARERQRRKVITYGFRTQEEPRRFVYCPQLYFRADATLDERLYMFKKSAASWRKPTGAS